MIISNPAIIEAHDCLHGAETTAGRSHWLIYWQNYTCSSLPIWYPLPIYLLIQ